MNLELCGLSLGSRGPETEVRGWVGCLSSQLESVCPWGVGPPSDRELPDGGVLEPAQSMPSRSVVKSWVPGATLENTVTRKMVSWEAAAKVCYKDA